MKIFLPPKGAKRKRLLLLDTISKIGYYISVVGKPPLFNLDYYGELMSNLTMLFEKNSEIVSIPASEMLVKSAGFDIVGDKLCFIFSTSEGKRGYGKQAIPVDQLEECYLTLSEIADNGVMRMIMFQQPLKSYQTLLFFFEDGSVRFKTQGDKERNQLGLCLKLIFKAL